jgi:membrane protease YdiL (CAAX protease family)
MTVKRIVLSIVTVIVLIPLLLSLGESFNSPQVQSDLQLSQTNLILQASEIQLETLNLEKWSGGKAAILGRDPLKMALDQYQSALTGLKNRKKTLAEPDASPLDNLPDIGDVPASDRQKQRKDNQTAIQKTTVKLGLIEATRGNTDSAIAHWQSVAATGNSPQTKVAIVLQDLWQEKNVSPQQIPVLESLLDANLGGWFRDRALFQLYSLAAESERLERLEIRTQTDAQQALVKLAALSLIPLSLGLIGCGILIVLLAQWLLQKDRAFLAMVGQMHWETPWDGETIWQVLVVGFFLVGQLIVPVAMSLLGLRLQSMGLRGKAVYVLVSYLTMTAAGLSVLFYSIKTYFPLPKGWFRFVWCDRSIAWGLGGYLVALPLVVLISLLNQSIWQGQGGSNPLLSLALESKDGVVLGIFFFTAGVAAPFFEEMMFRGFLIPSLTRYVPVWGAIAISSLIFAFAHLNLSEVLPLVVLGTILGVVYTRSQNLLASMVLHGLWNSGTLLSLFVLGSGG